MLAPKAHVLIDSLPFTKGGNERSKVILKSKFVKLSKYIKVWKTSSFKLKKTGEGWGSTEEEVWVKLPKLVIGEFENTHLNWFRVWNQNET